MHIRIRTPRLLCCLLALMMLSIGCATEAFAAHARVALSSAGVYKSAGAKSPAAKLSKGTTVSVLKEGKTWLKIKHNGKVGYMKKSAMQKAAPKARSASPKKAKASLRTLRAGSSGAAVKQVQARLAAKGYLAKSGVTGRYGSGTKTAIRKFQMFNSLSVNGTASVSTQKKLFSSSARPQPKVSFESWGSSGIDSHFPSRSTATIIDLGSGTRIRIRRLYGSNHCDVEPVSKTDTARLKAIYGGAWSWDSRGVVLIAGGKCFAAAINSMPHGDELSHSNGYPGQFCLHLKDSKTHGSNKENADHQASIAKVHAYFN